MFQGSQKPPPRSPCNHEAGNENFLGESISVFRLQQGLSGGNDLAPTPSPRGHSEMSGDSCDCYSHVWGVCYWHLGCQGSDADKRPPIQRIAPTLDKEVSSPKCQVVGFRNKP